MISNSEYTPLYYVILSFFTFFLSLPLLKLKETERLPKNFEKIGIAIMFIISVLFIGLRDPYDNDIYFGDTIRYTYFYENLNEIETYKDYGYHAYMYFFKNILTFDIVAYYLSTSFIYVYLQYRSLKNLNISSVLYPFVILCTTMSFWNYGINGIRAGLASAFFLYGLTTSKRYARILTFLVSFLIHKSFILPIAALYIVNFCGSVKIYLRFWILTVFISILMGNVILDFVSQHLSFLVSDSDDRVNNYITSSVTPEGGRFRLDFVIYSLVPILLATYFIYIKKFNNLIYSTIFKTYLLTNGIWILLIYANFTNRFAYLSWILIPILIIYPLIFQKGLVKNRYLFIWCVIIINICFTLLMFFKNSLI